MVERQLQTKGNIGLRGNIARVDRKLRGDLFSKHCDQQPPAFIVLLLVWGSINQRVSITHANLAEHRQARAEMLQPMGPGGI